jgi:hypothetical protein
VHECPHRESKLKQRGAESREEKGAVAAVAAVEL